MIKWYDKNPALKVKERSGRSPNDIEIIYGVQQDEEQLEKLELCIYDE